MLVCRRAATQELTAIVGATRGRKEASERAVPKRGRCKSGEC